MNINRNNYESFFLMYVDKELSAEEQRAVEAFVQAHPDLEEELQLLNSARLIPDESIQFEHKELLYRQSNPVLSAEWEEKLLRYIDQELSPAEKIAFENKLATDTVLQNELAAYRQTILTIDNSIQFPDKASLYKEEKEPARVIWFTWKRMAVAAVLLLAVSTSALLLMRNTGGEVENPMAGTEIKTPASTPSNNVEQPVVNPILAKEDKDNTASTGETLVKTPATVNKDKKTEINNGKADTQAPVYLVNNGNRNNLPTPRNQSVAGNEPANQTLYASVDPVKTSLTPDRQIDKADLIESTNNSLDPSLTVNNGIVTNPSFTSYNITDDGNKRSRGLLRKVTRLFEKTTNIKATTDDNKLLIGSFAVSLK
ncbi:MAG: hypothetical protein J0M30_04425 [Chitinophagales bacterium]|nr:hypothetical protein [Chitinophagales bacterium]